MREIRNSWTEEVEDPMSAFLRLADEIIDEFFVVIEQSTTPDDKRLELIMQLMSREVISTLEATTPREVIDQIHDYAHGEQPVDISGDILRFMAVTTSACALVSKAKRRWPV